MYTHIFFLFTVMQPSNIWYSFVICTLILEHMKKQKSWVVGNLKHKQPCKIQNFISIFGNTRKYYNEICNSVSILNKGPHGNTLSIPQSKPQGLEKALSGNTLLQHIHIVVNSIITLCQILASRYQHSRGIQCLHLQGCSSEMFVQTHAKELYCHNTQQH